LAGESVGVPNYSELAGMRSDAVISDNFASNRNSLTTEKHKYLKTRKQNLALITRLLRIARMF
jgi:hypothetical protein